VGVSVEPDRLVRAREDRTIDTQDTPRFSREPFEEEFSVDADALLALYSTTSSLAASPGHQPLTRPGGSRAWFR
jgi:hypothetical protein